MWPARSELQNISKNICIWDQKMYMEQQIRISAFRQNVSVDICIHCAATIMTSTINRGNHSTVPETAVQTQAVKLRPPCFT